MIRDAKEKDIKGILEIYNDAILNTTAIYTYKPHTLEERTEWYLERKSEEQPVLVFEENGEVAGFASYEQFRGYRAFKYSLEHSVYVNKNYRRRGIGEKLMKRLIEIANEKGYSIMVAAIDSANDSSIRLHKKLGFEYSGTIKKTAYKFGKWLDLDFYQLYLKGPEKPIEE